MKTRSLIAIVGSAAVLGAVGWMVYDGMQVNEVKVSRVKLQPDAKAPSPAPVTNAQITPKTPAPSVEKVSTSSAETAVKPAKKSDHINFVIPQENLSHLYIVKCSACHGKDGGGPVGSSIAGKSYEYNLKKLKEYKENKVENTMMEDLLTRTSNEELEQLAKEISAFKPRS